MKKIYVTIGTIFTILLLISTVIAIPQVNSKPLIDKINEIEEYKKTIDEKIRFIDLNVENGGLIVILLKIIELFIEFIFLILEKISWIFSLFELPDFISNILLILNYIIVIVLGFIYLAVIHIIDLINPWR